MDSGSRETYFNPQIWENIFWKFLEDLIFDGILEKFLIIDSRSTDHDSCSSVRIFGLPTSEPEIAFFHERLETEIWCLR